MVTYKNRTTSQQVQVPRNCSVRQLERENNESMCVLCAKASKEIKSQSPNRRNMQSGNYQTSRMKLRNEYFGLQSLSQKISS